MVNNLFGNFLLKILLYLSNATLRTVLDVTFFLARASRGERAQRGQEEGGSSRRGSCRGSPGGIPRRDRSN